MGNYQEYQEIEQQVAKNTKTGNQSLGIADAAVCHLLLQKERIGTKVRRGSRETELEL